MTFAKKIIMGSGSRVIGLVINTVVGLFMMPFIVHSLGDRSYGYWALVGGILGYYGLLDLGIVSAVQYHVAKSIGERDEKSANQAISTSFFAFAVIGLLALGITIAIAVFSETFIRDPQEAALFRNVILLLGATLAIGFPCRAFIGAISAHLRYDLGMIANLGSLAIRTVLIVYFLKQGHGIFALALITGFTEILAYTCNYFILRNIQENFEISFRLVSVGTFKEIFRYAFLTFFIKIADQLRYYVDVFVISAYIGVAAVTHYSIASRLSLHYMDLMIALLGVLSPLFSIYLGNRDHEKISRSFIFMTKISVIVSTFIGLTLILYGKPFIHLWMGIEYSDAYIPLIILVIAIFTDVSQLPSVSYFYGVAKHRYLAVATGIEAVANLLLSLYLVRKYGMIGVALGTMIPMVIFKMIVQPVYICRSTGIPVGEYYLKLSSGIVIVSSGMVIPWLLFLKDMTQGNLFSIATLLLVHLAVVGVLSFCFVFNRNDRLVILENLIIDGKFRKYLVGYIE